jgi:predicted dinucleotide-binding enzyme
VSEGEYKMKIGILGSGVVGQTIGAKLVELGHEVKVGTRDPQKLEEWRTLVGPNASAATFAETAAFGEILFNCTSGAGSLNALHMAGEANLKDKILIDIANPLDFSRGMPPTLLTCNDDSLAEQIQRAHPELKVVKTLNTVTARVMVNPALLSGDHDMFVCGNDPGAKAAVVDLLKQWLGWKSVLDLGDLTAARGMEMWLPLWIRLMSTLQTPLFNLKLVR